MSISFDISTRKLSVQVDISGKYNVIVGDTGSGKTELVEMCDRVYRGAPTSKKLPLEVIGASTRTLTDIYPLLYSKSGAVFVIDEETLSVGGHNLSRAIINSANFFIFTARERLPMIPYGIENVYVLEGNRTHKKMVRKYKRVPKAVTISYDSPIIVEDSSIGYEVALRVLSSRGFRDISSSCGKDKVSDSVRGRDGCIVIADLCGFGSNYERLLDVSEGKLYFCDFISFEHELLSNGLGINAYLTPTELIRYKSEEDAYLVLLKQTCRVMHGLDYSKSDKMVKFGRVFNYGRMYPEMNLSKSITVDKMCLD